MKKSLNDISFLDLGIGLLEEFLYAWKTKNYKKEAETGDIVGVERSVYEHYGIFTEKGTVIHYTADDTDLMGKNQTIQETSLERFLRKADKYFVLDIEHILNNKVSSFLASSNGILELLGDNIKDIVPISKLKELSSYYKKYEEKVKIYSPEETVKRARSRIGESNYDLFENNCEHFAIWCKTGLSRSTQIEALIKLSPRGVIDKVVHRLKSSTEKIDNQKKLIT